MDPEVFSVTEFITKEEEDYQFYYPGRNKVLKKYKNITDFYSWDSKKEGAFVYRSMSKNVSKDQKVFPNNLIPQYTKR